MRTSGGAEHIAVGNSRSSLIRSGDTCWSVQAIHWLSKGKTDRQATLVSLIHLWPSLILSRKIVDRLVFPLLGDCFSLHCQAGG